MEVGMDAADGVEEYLAALPGDQRAALEDLRATIRAAAPEATEAQTTRSLSGAGV